ncbi:T9SS type A sorting domain-containing protein [Ekhidna sp.]|uniref:T9SS type A sorting domain-containing protein n=1 Tax=Ekhidna sp. TaxID=2608089 RepID=UPI0032997C97
MRSTLKLSFLALLFHISVFSVAQSGPAGVRDNSSNLFWLRGDVGLFESGGLVSLWEDQAASNDANPPTSQEPAYTDPAINGIAGVTFSTGKELSIANSGSINTSNFSSKTIFLVFSTPSSFSGTQVLYEQGNSSDGLIIYLDGSGQLNAGVYNSTNDYFITSGVLSTSTDYIATFTFDGGVTTIEAFIDNNSLGTNTSTLATVTGTSGDITLGDSGDGNQISGGSTITNGSAGFTGSLSEAIYYNVALNDAEVTIVNNYLGEKYGIALSANDEYVQAGYETDLVGIGRQTAGNTYTSITGSGGEVYFDESGASLDADDEWVFAGHNGQNHGTTKSDMAGSLTGFSRWTRIWYLEKTGTVDITLSFDTEEAGFGNADDIGTTGDFKLLYSTDPSTVNFTEASGAPTASFTDGNAKVTFTMTDANLADGYYTLGVTEIVNFYSYRSGDWDDPLNWTTDPSGSIRVNPDSRYPNQATDNVTILNGDEIDLDANAVTSNGGAYTIGDMKISTGGILDLEGTSGHSFENFTGKGTLVMEGDNFPTVNATNIFITAAGGTVQLAGSSDFTFNSGGKATYNNLDIAVTSATITLIDSLILNGDLEVSSGTLRINDDSGTDIIRLEIAGDVSVGSGASFTVGLGDAYNDRTGETNVRGVFDFHQIDLKGGFTNEGTTTFTNINATSVTNLEFYEAYPSAGDQDNDNGAGPLDATEFGVVELLMTNDSENQNITCNGICTFYRIEVDKGIDDTYICEINANSQANFNLYGRVAFQQHFGTDETLYENPRALGLEKGTLKLGDNIILDEICRNDPSTYGGNSARVCTGSCNSDYVIFPDARLWIAGTSSVSSEDQEGLHIMGKLKVSDNGVLSKTGAGKCSIVFDDNAVVEITGGTVTVNQVRTKSNGVDPQGAWIHTGGTVTVNPLSTGTGSRNTHALFSLPFSTMNFTMTEPDPTNPTILNIEMEDLGDNDRPKQTSGEDVLIQIAVGEGNYSVTGGTVTVNILESSVDQDHGIINSTIPFWNLTLDKISTNNQEHKLRAVNASGTASPASAIQDLVVLNDFRMLDNGCGCTNNNRVRFDTNGANMTIGNGFFIESNTFIDTDENTMTFNGTSAIQRISVEGEMDYGPGGSKSSGMYQMILTGSGTKRIEGSLTPFEIGDSLVIASGAILDDNGFTIEVNGDIYNAGTHTGDGKIELTGGSANHNLDGDGTGIFANLELDDTNGASFAEDFFIYDTLIMTSGILDIDIYGLTLATDSSGISGTGYSTTKYIRTAGNASDEGISMYLANDRDDYLFPIGTDQESGTDKYTPVAMSVSGVNGIDSGYVKISVADDFLPTIDPTETSKLSYYWRLNHSGFDAGTLPDISLQLNYDDEDIVGNENQYNGGYVLDEAPFTRVEEDANDDDRTINELIFNGTSSNNGTFPGNRLEIINANFSAAGSNAWNGAPEVYYSRATDGTWWEWQDTQHWSTDAVNQHLGAAASDYPQAGDIAVVGSVYVNALGCDPCTNSGTGRHQIRIDNTVGNVTVAQLIFDSQAGGTALNVTDMSRVRIRGGLTLDGGIIGGTGELVQDVGTVAQTGTITGDLGDFIEERDNGFFYWFQSVTDVTITDRFEFPIFRTFGADGTLDFSQDVTAHGIVVDNGTTMSISTNWTIDSLIQIGSNGAGTLEFPDVGSNVTLECGTLVYSNDTGNNISVENTGTDIHRLKVNEDITLDVGTGFDLTSAAGAQVELEVSGSGSHSFINNTGVTADLYRLIVNKGSDQSATFTFDDNFTLSATSSGTTKPLELQNGTLILNNSSIDLDVNGGGGDFEVPSTSGLQITNGTIRVNASGTGSGNGVRLDGKLTIDGGNAILTDGANGDNYIEYGSGGNAEIELSSGNFIVGSQVRRSTLSSTGILTYNQTGGIALFGVNTGATFENDRGVFELTDGSFTLGISSGTDVFALVDAQANPTNGSFILGSSITTPTVNISDASYIDFGYNDGTYTTTGSPRFDLNSYVGLSNIRIDSLNSGSPTVRLVVNNLDVSNDIHIQNSGVLDANGFQINLGGDLENDGTYTPNNNLFVFDGSSQQISGTTATTFYDLTVNSSGTVSTDNVSVPISGITISNDFLVNSGTFDDQGVPTNVGGNIDIVTTYDGSGGLTINGASSQEITSTDRAGTVSKLVIDNSSGVTLAQTSGGEVVTLTIDDEIAIDNGVFNISDNRLFIDGDATITTTGAFDENTMISVNGVKKSDGIEKEFNSNTSFTIPLGVPGKYTPVDVVVNSSETATLLFKAINSSHPSATGTDVLDYYWVITTSDSDITGFAGSSIAFSYIGSDINGNINNYANARLESPNWTKLQPPISGNGISSAVRTITWNDTDLGNNNFTGEYTIGDPDNIPDELLIYRTVSAANGNWSNTALWEISTDGGMSFSAAGEVPRAGSIVEIRSDADITMSSGTDNNQNIFSVDIEGTLNIGDSDGHNFGDVTGTGTMKLETGTLPGGNLDDFFTTTGGTVDFGGAGSFTIPADFTDVNGLVVSDGGTKSMPAIAYTIGSGGITIEDGSTLSNTNNVGFTSSGPITIINGTFNAGNSSTTITADDLILTAGAYNGNGVDAALSGDLDIAGGTFNAGSGDLNLSGNLDYTGGTFNNGSGKVIFSGTSNQIVNGDFKPDKMYNVEINKAGGQVYIGNMDTIAIANTLTLTSGRFNTLDSTNAAILLCDAGSGAGNYSRTGGFINGPILVELGNSKTFTFPVGKNSNYKPFSVNSTSGQAGVQVWEVEFYKLSPVSNEAAVDNFTVEASSNVQAIVPDEYWRVNTASPANGTTFRLDGSVNTMTQDEIDDQELRVLLWDDAGTEWDDLGGVASGTPSNASIVSTLGTSFSENYFTYGSESSSSTLPVELIHFSGIAENHQVILTWETASEINNDFFEVQRSPDGVSFDIIGVVDGSGNSNEPVKYAFRDKEPYLGLNYYRLRQVDFDGAEELLPIIQVDNDSKLKGILISTYPNPATSENLNIRILSGDDHTLMNMRIVDMSGRLYAEKQYEGTLLVDEKIKTERRMVPGIYFMMVEQGGNIQSHKIIIK